MLTKEQHLIRKTGLGGSDISAIIGCNPYSSALDIYIQKTSDELPQDINNDYTYFGNVLEPVVAAEYSKRTGLQVSEEPATLRHPKYDFALANIDRWVGNREFVLECKTTAYLKPEIWGEEGTDQIPDFYLTQIAWYAAVAGVPRVDLAVLAGGNKFRIYTYKRNEEFENHLLKLAEKFWVNCVLAKQAPIYHSTSAAVKDFYKKDNGQEIEADNDIYQRVTLLKEKKQQLKALQEEVDTITKDIQLYMGSNSCLKQHDVILATWKQSKPRVVIDTKTLKEQEPDLFKKYAKETVPSRSFVIK